MRFLRPDRSSADAEVSNDTMRATLGNSTSSGQPRAMPEGTRMNDARSQSQRSEGERILLDRIDSLTARLVICEHVIQRFEQNSSSHDAITPAVDPREIEERLRRQVERQIADVSAELELRQNEFMSKQAKLLDLLASELRKIRSMFEVNAGTRKPEAPAAQFETRTTHLPRRGHETETGVELDFFDIDRDVAASSPEHSAPLSHRARESQDFEFWDWLESLPRKPVEEPAAQDITYDDLNKMRSR